MNLRFAQLGLICVALVSGCGKPSSSSGEGRGALEADKKSNEPKQEEIALVHHWLSHTSEASIHQLRGASGNTVYLHKDGHEEAVYDAAGNLVKDGVNDGSYNYSHPVEEPLQHFSQDILPWILWGASRSDPTSVEERLEAYSRSLGGGLGSAKDKPLRKFDDKKLEDAEIQVVVFFLRVIEEGEVQEIFKILNDPEFEPREPLKIGKGLTKGLIKVVNSGDFQPVKPDVQKAPEKQDGTPN